MKTDLETLLIQKIGSEGPISLYDFMSLALYHPQYGYYKNPNRIGQNGDFITSPEISQVFGELITLWFIVKWQEKWPEGPLTFLELGPGRGTFLTDFLRVLKKMPDLNARIQCYCLETNPYHKAEITKKCAAIKDIHFIESFAELPESPLFFFGNEFFDAFPIQQFVYQNQKWQELYITFHDDFQLTIGESNQALQAYKAYFPTAPNEGDLFELNSAMISLMTVLSMHLQTHGGAGLIIDYGDFSKPPQSSLQAVKGHRQVPIFTAIGETDLTTHIDFSCLDQIAKEHGMTSRSFSTQRDFLLSLGLRDRVTKLCESASSAEKKADIISRAERLVDQSQMGELFKAMSFE